MRDGLRTILELEDDLIVVGEAGDGEAGIALFQETNPDVVLMDIQMPGMDGVEATRRLVADHPTAKIIILTTFDNDEYVFEGLRVGAVGYLLKALSGAELADAIRKVASGQALIDPSVTRKVMAEFARLARPSRGINAGIPDPLSDRESQILKHLAQGMTNREIAQELFLAEGTVKNYVTNVLHKIGVRDRTQAALRGRELGLL
jgi:DNA-binding NarL/FixJ family response regulator